MKCLLIRLTLTGILSPSQHALLRQKGLWVRYEMV